MKSAKGCVLFRLILSIILTMELLRGEMSVSRYIAPQMPWECSPAIWYTSE